MSAIYVSIGHGVRPDGVFDPGAVDPASGAREYDGNRDLAARVTALLREVGHQVESEADLPPSTDTDYQGSVNLVNTRPRALAVDFHQDWNQGSTALCWPLVHPGGSESHRIADQITASCAARGLSTKGPTDRTDLWWLNGTNCPAVLIEAGRVGTPRPMPELAEAIASGIHSALTGEPGIPEGSFEQPPGPGGAPPGDATLPPPSDTPAWPGVYLRNTTTDPAAEAWQAQMRKRGWQLEVDGVYGPAFTAVCVDFQVEKHLYADGVVGPDTWTAAYTLPVS